MVSDSATGRPLRQAVSGALEVGPRCRADPLGRCRLCRLPEGVVELSTWAPWHLQRSDTVLIDSERVDTLRVLLSLPPGQPGNLLVVHGVTYSMGNDNTSYMLSPVWDQDIGTAPLSPTERLIRCDELVDAILRHAGVDRTKIEFVRDSTAELSRGSRVIYRQWHHGYPILSAGAALTLDEDGYVELAGLDYESRELPTFVPMKSARLRKIAARAVPFPAAGEPWTELLGIDPMGYGRARLLYHATFLVETRGRKE